MFIINVLLKQIHLINEHFFTLICKLSKLYETTIFFIDLVYVIKLIFVIPSNIYTFYFNSKENGFVMSKRLFC